MQGLIAAGEDLVVDWSVDGESPYDALASYQKSDGPFVWQWESPYGPPLDNGLATFQAIPALLGAFMPVAPPESPRAYTPVYAGPDPDRLVVQSISVSLDGDLVKLGVPFGADLNRDSAAEFMWRKPGTGTWTPIADAGRSAGVFTATVPLSQTLWYEVAVTLTDADGVQHAQELSTSVTLQTLFRPPLSWSDMCLRTNCAQRWWRKGPNRLIGVS
jgi:hypothetical protein